MEPGGQKPLTNWLDLPRDLTIQIFIKVGVVGILCSVQGVCSSWRAIARDPRLYRVIDLRDCVTIDIHSFSKCCFCPPIKLYFWKSFKDNEFVNLATEAIDRSCGQAIEFSINADLLSFFDQFLYQLPYKTPGLKCFRLTEGWSVSDCCISKVFPKLPLLEEVEFCNCYFSKEVIEVVGRSCPKLKSFRMNDYRENSSPLEDEEDEEMRNDCALAIAENMNPSVRSLHLFGDSMNNTGLEAILDRFSQLEYLDLRQCVNIDLNGDLLKRCQAIERFRPPNDSTDDYSGEPFRVMAPKKEKAPPPSKPAKSGGGKQKKKEAYGNEPSDSSEDDDEWVEADSPPKKKDDGTGKNHHCLQMQIYQQLRAEEISRARGRGVQTTLETLQRDMKKDNEGANSSAETTSDGPEPNLTGKQATASANKTLGDAVTQEAYGNGPSDSSEDDDEWVEADSPSKKKGDGTREESSLSPKANLPTTMSRRNTKSSRKRSSKDSGDTSKRRKCTKKDNEGGNSSAETTRDGPEPNLTGKKATASANKTLGDAVTQGIMFERKVERLHAETNNLMMRVEEHYQEIMSFRENLNVIMADALQDTLRQLRSESWRLDDVEGIDSLRWEDQQKIRKYLESGVSSSNTTTESSSEYGIEVSQTSRATCKGCSQKIIKAEVRISTKPEGKGPRGLTWHHAKCFLDSAPSIQVEKLSGWESLSVSEQEAVNSLRKGNSVKSNVVDELPKKSSTGGTKRKNDITSGQKSKIHKTEGNVPVGDGPVEYNSTKPDTSDLESKLEAQSKKLWAIKDELKKRVSTAELREMLELNGQLSTGSEFDLRDRCADGMLFGVLGSCPMCNGHLSYSGGQYSCHGYLSEWCKCSYTTTESNRLNEKWKVPVETSNQYLSKWFKSQKGQKPVRVLPPPSSPKASGSQVTNGKSNMKSENVEDLKVAITGAPKKTMEDWKSKIENVGGVVHTKIKKDTSCLVISGGGLNDQDPEIKKARRMKLPIVREDYLVNCIEKKKMLPFDLYRVESVGDGSKSMVTVKVKGRSAVHESSGLQDSGHILEDGNNIYNTTLNMSDLSTGINSYYILQIIQDDGGKDCHVFRKWGRVGNDKIGSSKLDEGMSKFEAIDEFKRLFLEKTGNPWEAWVQKKNFQKQPGRFFPLDIDYGVNKQVSKKKNAKEKSLLAPPLIELMNMLFNIETYRAAMMEFEINMAEMPLGKLSKSNIQQGFAALTEIQNLLSNSSDPSRKEIMLVDWSNRFFTLIPSVHPHVIRHEDDFKSKLKMLEALQDIEIASKLVGFEADNGDSLDENYKKLGCDISPLAHDSEDFQLIKNYLHTTHAPTHTSWALELEDVFALERKGETDKYATHRNKLQNKMLLWHGSRLTNFVGILSQGLRIAPPEAPATGYMFGKGVYFADMVSKSAQYCFTDKKNPVGLMILSEVALGEVHELKKATYMEKPPRGKHSTKGLGKTIPRPSEYVKWKEEVVVPCGKPVPSNVKSTELMYNEYIVYDTAQVKMQFLLKVRFHHK